MSIFGCFYEDNMKGIKYITNETAIDTRYARMLAEQGEGDWRVQLMAALEDSNDIRVVIWLETNGGPRYIGTLDEDGEWAHLAEEEDDEGRPLWGTCLEEVGITATSPEEAAKVLWKNYRMELLQENYRIVMSSPTKCHRGISRRTYGGAVMSIFSCFYRVGRICCGPGPWKRCALPIFCRDRRLINRAVRDAKRRIDAKRKTSPLLTSHRHVIRVLVFRVLMIEKFRKNGGCY